MRAPLVAAGTLLALGCADPASVRVQVQVREPQLQDIEVALHRSPSNHDTLIFQCALQAGGKSDCPFEDPRDHWAGGADLSFVLYGEPGTELRLELAGVRRERTVTATSAIFSLPRRSGEDAVLELALIGRTSVRRRCALDIGEVVQNGNNDRSALTVADVDGDPRTLEILASTARTSTPAGLAVVRYAASGRDLPVSGEDRCELSALPAAREAEVPLPCRLYEGSLVAAARPDGTLVAAQCSTTEGRYVALLIAAPERRFVHTYGLPDSLRRTCSKPVLYDADGDGAKDVVFLCSRDRQLYLHRWSPRKDPAQDSTQSLLLSGVQAYNNGNVGLGPIVVDRAGVPPALLVAGYGGGYVLVLRDGRTVRFPNSAGGLVRAPSAWLTDQGVLQVVFALADGVHVHELALSAQGATLSGQFLVPVPAELVLTPDLDVRLALGRLPGEGVPSAVLIDAGKAYAFPLGRDLSAHPLPLWQGTGIAGVQIPLLADLDGQAGVEILGFDAQAGTVFAADASGTPLDGWPQTLFEGFQHRVLLTDLDQVRAAEPPDVELVALSGRRLEVLSLGPGSYDLGETPWPAPYRDAASTGLAGPVDRDPFR